MRRRGPGIIVRFGRILWRALALGNIAQIDPDASPVDRPRIESTRTSSTCSRAAASGYRAFQRSYRLAIAYQPRGRLAAIVFASFLFEECVVHDLSLGLDVTKQMIYWCFYIFLFLPYCQ